MAYIVINDTMGTATVLLKKDNEVWSGVPKAGILLIDEKTATEFPNREAANRAVTRSEDYFARKVARSREVPVFRVFRLQPEALAK